MQRPRALLSCKSRNISKNPDFPLKIEFLALKPLKMPILAIFDYFGIFYPSYADWKRTYPRPVLFFQHFFGLPALLRKLQPMTIIKNDRFYSLYEKAVKVRLPAGRLDNQPVMLRSSCPACESLRRLMLFTANQEKTIFTWSFSALFIKNWRKMTK